jgi:hypothetical protein
MNLLRGMPLRQDSVLRSPIGSLPERFVFALGLVQAISPQWIKGAPILSLNSSAPSYKRPLILQKLPISITLVNMPSPVQSGQEIVVPLFDADTAGAPVHVNWQQNLSQRKADYYALTADNITTGSLLS